LIVGGREPEFALGSIGVNVIRRPDVVRGRGQNVRKPAALEKPIRAGLAQGRILARYQISLRQEKQAQKCSGR
jgi:hypothetical protein